MAAEFDSLVVLYSPTAENELWEIWKYNAKTYGLEHADAYEEFLLTGINSLPERFHLGKKVADWPQLRYLILKRSSGGEGHYVVYETALDEGTIFIHHIFHTRMEVSGRLQADPDQS